MKKLYFVVTMLFVCGMANAQVVNIPDAKFKAKLLASSTANNIARDNQYQNIKIDANNDGEIQQSEALAVYHLYARDLTFSNNNDDVTSFEGLQYFTNLRTFDGLNHLVTSFEIYLPNIEDLNIGYNNISFLNVNGLTTLTKLSVAKNNISDLVLTGLINLKSLDCSQNPLGSLNIQGLTALEVLWCTLTGITTLDLSGHPNLNSLYCKGNNLTDLDFTGAGNISTLQCGGNALTVLDVSGLPHLISLDAKPMATLTAILANSEATTEIALANGAAELPNLRYICVREIVVPYFNELLAQYGYTNCTAGSYCPIADGVNHNTIEGKVRFDNDFNGCTPTDALTPNVMININDGTQSGYTYTNNQGFYRFPVATGNFTITPVYNNQYYNITPSLSSTSITSNFNTHTADFCIAATGNHPDLEVKIIPTMNARPGFNARYNIVLINKGDMVQSGVVNFIYNDATLDYISSNPLPANQSAGNLSWSFTNLLPFQTKLYDLTLKVNSPVQTPAVNINDILTFTASIATAQTDDTPADNTFQFNQTVVGSYDPNDKQVVQGTAITPAQATGYLDYIIRFQNTGTAEAINVVVKDMLASNLDPATFVPIAASHPYRATLSASNKLEFIFEGINLPAEEDNEPASHGFIAFKVKPKNTVAIGDVLSNTAEIYFDYNAPIITNTVSTTVATLLAGDFDFGSELALYPNPSSDVVTITKKSTINITSIAVYNMLGQLVLVMPNNLPDNNIPVNISSLKSGNYIIEINSDKGKSAKKFIKN